MKKELSYLDTVKTIDKVRKFFEGQLESRLSLIKVQSPLFVKSDSGLQDALTGVEKGVSFKKESEKFEIVHSLAKWKRDALGRYDFPMHTGLYTDMKAIRKDEKVDDIHSLFVEQWDWEKVISEEDRTIDYLKETVKSIYKSLRQTAIFIEKKYKLKMVDLPKSLFFITSQELEDMYPSKTPKEREEIIVKEKKCVFIIGIGDMLKSGIPHDLRSPDYDDWSLDGDLIVYDKVIDKAVELSSMGIRVNKESLLKQLKEKNEEFKLDLPYHQDIINNRLPLTIGGGIGQSRMCMFMLKKVHIGEVQTSYWPEEDIKLFLDNNIHLL